MSWMLPQSRNLRRALTLLCAMCLAGAATWSSHRWMVRRDVPRRIEYGFYTKSMKKMLDLPPPWEEPEFEVQPEDFEEQPHYGALCRRVAERARLYMQDSSAGYDVYLVGMFPCRGFPFISRDWTAKVDVQVIRKPIASSKQYLFIVGQDGNPPILYGGLIGNWLFYLAVSAAMLYGVEKAIIALMIRRQRRRHGFPVVMANED